MSDFIKRKVFHFLGTVQEPFYTWLNALANVLILLRNPEKVQHLGQLNPDKTFYVIRDVKSDVGVAGWYDAVLGYVDRALRKGWVPVVDAPPPVFEDGGCWYDFFKGPTDYSMEEVLKSKNVVFAVTQGMIHKRYSRRNITRRHELCKMVVPSDRLQRYLDEQLPLLFNAAPKKMVAVRYRGTDYRYALAHAKVPDMDFFCKTVEADMVRWGVPVGEGEHIFFVTEDQAAFEAFTARFPKCRYVVKERISNYERGCICLQRMQTLSPLMNDFMYMLEVYALSQCDYLIGGVNGGVLMALNLNGNRYSGVHVMNTGVN